MPSEDINPLRIFIYKKIKNKYLKKDYPSQAKMVNLYINDGKSIFFV